MQHLFSFSIREKEPVQATEEGCEDVEAASYWLLYLRQLNAQIVLLSASRVGGEEQTGGSFIQMRWWYFGGDCAFKNRRHEPHQADGKKYSNNTVNVVWKDAGRNTHTGSTAPDTDD